MTDPAKGSPSHGLFVKETSAILASLGRRAEKLVTALNTLEGVTCNPAKGAMYAFPKITLPKHAIDAAKAEGKRLNISFEPDELYCREILIDGKVCLVPGSGFRQVDGTYHFRTTFLPSEDDMAAYIAAIRKAHARFLQRYSRPNAIPLTWAPTKARL